MLFEIRYQTSQSQLWVAGFLFLLLGFGFARFTLSGEGVWINAPYSIAFNLALLSLLSVLPVTVLVAPTALREIETGMHDIIRSTPFPRRKRILYSIGGLLTANLAILILSLTGMIIGSVTLNPDTVAMGPFYLSYYLIPFTVFIIPNTLLLIVFQFLVAKKSGNTLAVYLSGIMIYIGYFAISMLGGSPLIAGSAVPDPEGLFWAGIADPLGLTAFLEQTRTWTAGQMNSLTIELKGAMLYNRMIWLAATAALGYLGVVLQNRSASTPKKDSTVESASLLQPASYTFHPQKPAGWQYFVSSIISQVRMQLSTLFRSRWFVAAGIFWIVLVGTELSDSIGDGEFDTPFFALSELILPALFAPFPAIGYLLIIFFVGEIVWLTHATGIYPLTDATPVPDSLRFGAVLCSTAALVCVLISLMLIPAFGYQLLKGGSPDPKLYASLFYLLGLPWLLTGTLTAGIQTFSPNKYLGMFVTAFIVIIWPPILMNLLGLQTYLLQFPGAPDPDYSAFAGFGPFIHAFNGYMLFWSLFCFVVAILSVKGSKRGIAGGLASQIKKISETIDRSSLRLLVTTLVLVIFTGGYIVVSRTDQGHHISKRQKQQWKAAYEKNFYKYAHDPLLSIQKVELNVHLYPETRSYQVTGHYRVHNGSDRPVDTLLIGWNKTITNRQITVNRAEPEVEYASFNHFIFSFENLLQPGDSARIDFSMKVDQNAFSDYDPAHSVIRNGTFIRLERFIPWIGYDTGLQLKDPKKRVKYGLSEIPPEPGRPSRFNKHRMKADYEMTVSTGISQQVAAPGELVKNWTRDERNYFRFKSTEAMRLRYAIASAEYQKEEISMEGFSINLFYHPGHAMNIPLLQEAGRSSIKIFGNLYGSLPRQSITIAEIPSYRSGGILATSYPGVIFIREQGGYTGDFSSLPEDNVNYLYRRTAHELAHQWWGEKLNPDRTVPGAALLTETLAEYSAALVIKHKFGEDTYNKLMDYERNQYLLYRNRTGEETSLLEVTSSTDYIAYFKGPLVLDAVAELIGEQHLIDLLQNFMVEFGDGATARDFYKHLKAKTPEKHHPLLKRWFEQTEDSGIIDK